MEVNVTLVSVLVIIFLFIPGFFLKRFYFIGQFTKQFTAGTFAERFITNIFWGIIVQFISLLIVGNFIQTSYSDLREPINIFYTELSNNKLPVCTAQNFFFGIGYIFLNVFLAAFLGTLFHKIVRFLRIDVRFTVFRFTNYWNYYFKGDIPEMRKNKQGKVISTILDILISDGTGSTKLYKGFLRNYNISPLTGTLETIVLTQAERWSNTQNSFITIPGDSLIILHEHVVNMNLTYNTVRRDWKRIFDNIMNIIILLGIGAIFFYVLYFRASSIGWINTVVVIIFLLVDLLILLSIIAILVAPNSSNQPRTPMTKRSKSLAISILVVIGLIFFWVIKVLLK
jgi:hypothetical protein